MLMQEMRILDAIPTIRNEGQCFLHFCASFLAPRGSALMANTTIPEAVSVWGGVLAALDSLSFVVRVDENGNQDISSGSCLPVRGR